ncbi:hypothetical protein PoB_000045300 [Plakobranchus ocellatus]|uniref:Uncharacterized protein n=1 Tax=Plakobranchus ocellatus TaxID=259542 RepID=A0AAV3XUF8_9GAST|nr:hypothetical protein PoB_000045300 [Plakobranchus ocellatus]
MSLNNNKQCQTSFTTEHPLRLLQPTSHQVRPVAITNTTCIFAKHLKTNWRKHAECISSHHGPSNLTRPLEPEVGTLMPLELHATPEICKDLSIACSNPLALTVEAKSLSCPYCGRVIYTKTKPNFTAQQDPKA